MDPETLKTLFYYSQFLAAGVCVGLVIWFRHRTSDSGFRVWEADKLTRKADPQARKLHGPEEKKPEQPKRPLRLTGISVQGPAHEILGISPQASAEQIQKAYRDLMKRYHPDKIGRPGTREWNDAQKIAETINRARDEMLKRAQATGSNRSGR